MYKDLQHNQGSHYFQIRGRSELSSQGEVEDKRGKWGDFWEKLTAINQNIAS
jgi:hypothetical protein